MPGRAHDAAYTQDEIPIKVLGLFQNKPLNVIEKANRYNTDVDILKGYILDLRTDVDNLLGRLESLSTAEKYLGTLRKIQNIISEDVAFPIPC